LLRNQKEKTVGNFKRISDYTKEELDEAVIRAEQQITDFYTILNGVDAYMERRRRKLEAEGEPTAKPEDESNVQGRGESPTVNAGQKPSPK
jgi:hypothetical protein